MKNTVTFICFMALLSLCIGFAAQSCGGEDSEADATGDPCVINTDCPTDYRCLNEMCVTALCNNDAECPGDETCAKTAGQEQGYCQAVFDPDGDSECENGETRCSEEEEDTLEICSGGKWIFDRDCEKGCKNGVCGEDFEDGDENECNPGDVRCNGLDVEICRIMGEKAIWQFYLACDFGCDAGSCLAPDGDEEVETICNEGDKKCYDNMVMVCGEDKLSYIVEDPCMNGTCVGEPPIAVCGPRLICEPEMRVCADDDASIKVCNDEGDEWINVPCGNTEKCEGGQCVSNTFCSPGKYRCNEDLTQVFICDDAGLQWNVYDSCSDSEVCVCYNYVSDKCIQAGCDGQQICSPFSDKRCNGNTLQQCAFDGKSWSFWSNCANQDPPQVCVDNGNGSASCQDAP